MGRPPRVAGKVALITGGARNQGLAHGELLAREGATVILGDMSDAAGEAASQSLQAAGLPVRYLHLDVASPGDWQAAIEDIELMEGKLDILVNNAAILGPSSLSECSIEEWHSVMAVNQTGVFLGVQAVVAPMRRNGAGSIINISSVIGNLGTEFNFAYSVSKAAVQMITRTAAVSLAPAIRVNTIIPGSIDTDMLRSWPEEQRNLRLASYPMGRAGDVMEVANAVLFLASDEASFITGGELRVDGGALAGAKLPRRP